MKHLVILNGPPGSGKDTLAEIILKMSKGVFNCEHLRFKEALYEAAAELYKVDLEWFLSVSTDTKEKELPQAELKGKSPREALIDTSENHIKPKYGETYFGDRLAEKIKQLPDDTLIVVSDSGFYEELFPVVSTVDKLTLVHIFRAGCSFKNDSRKYLLAPIVERLASNTQFEYMKIINESSLEELAYAASIIITPEICNSI